MPARDRIHNAVKNAIGKAGWKITADPYIIKYDDVKLEADMEADLLLSAEAEANKIIVEVKSFVGVSPMHELECALGQYQIYSALLRAGSLEHTLYMAVSEPVYNSLFQRKAVQLITRTYNVHLLVVDIEKEEVVQWITSHNGEV